MGKVWLVLTTLFFCQIPFTNSSCVETGFTYTKGGVYEDNLNKLLNDLVSKSSSLKLYNTTFGNDPDRVYGLYQCRVDLSLDICLECVTNGTREIVKECPLYGEALLWTHSDDKCMLRYANSNFLSSCETSPEFLAWNPAKISNYDKFLPIFETTMKELIEDASHASPYFATTKANWTTSSEDQFYSYAQCTPDIEPGSCKRCLNAVLTRMMGCCSHNKGAKVLFPCCQSRFESGSFLNETFFKEVQSTAPQPETSPTPSGPPPIKKKGSLKPAIIGMIAACGVLLGLLVLSVVLWICLRRKKLTQASSDLRPPSPSDLLDEFKQYDFVTLEIATSNFAPVNKLGEGGFGSVYERTLANGEQIAIKRLSGSSGQGTKEFMTEARLLSRLQHRNLVKLLGFCSKGEEKLLVYEFMANSSLDGFLFDLSKKLLLSWVLRYKIIMGIARGLQYLHEDSRLTIIHRDLKPSNILLDEEMNPKIANFGLAKLFEATQRLGNTSRIAGTLGYMAPEYLMTGEYSDKSDIYSFGIMVLEILSGQNNIKFYQAQQKEDLAIHAWRLWNERRSFDLTYPTLDNNCSRNEVTRCTQISLLCLQANAEQRPTMALVVSMLTGSVDLPLPSPPAMSFPQFNMPSAYNDGQQSDIGPYFTSSVNVGTDVTQDQHLKV